MSDIKTSSEANHLSWQGKLRKIAPYDAFEQIISQILVIIISLIVLIALYKLGEDVISLLIRRAFDPLKHEVFQTIFGGIMTLLIAMEFKHSIIAVARREHSIIQVKTVLLISMLALTRKFIILDVNTLEAGKIAGLAVALLAMGAVYWLMREREAWNVEHGKEEES